MSGPDAGARRWPGPVCFLFFALGGCSLVVQTYLVREFLVVVHGTELAFGLLFASWLAWIGGAALLGVRVAQRVSGEGQEERAGTGREGGEERTGSGRESREERAGSREAPEERRREALEERASRGEAREEQAAAGRAARLLRWVVSVGALLPLAQVELVRHGHDLLGVAPGLIVSWQQTLLLSVLAMAPFCVMVGLAFPLGCRVLVERSSRGVGSLYAAEAAGALLGGALASFVLVGRVGAMPAVAGGAALLLGVSSFLSSGRSRTLGLGAAALVLLSTPLVARVDEASRRRQLASVVLGQELVAVFDTPYEQIAVGRLAEQLTIYGDGLPGASVPDPYGTPGVVYRALAQAPAPRRVLVLGSPVSGLAAALSRALDEREATRGAQLTFVHADEALVRALTPYLPDEEAQVLASRVRLVVDDPRAFLVRTREAFDLVLVDAPEPTAAHVNRFYTVEFFTSARRVLAPGGVLCFSLTSADYVGREVSQLALSVRKALAQAFPVVVMTAGDESWFFAGDASAALSADAALVAARLREFPGARAYRDDIALDYEPGRVRRLEELLSAGGDAITNSDEHPSSYHYGAVLWERFSSEQPSATSWLARAHAAVLGLARWQVALALLGLVALWLLARRLSPRHAPTVDAGLTVAAAGFTSMAFNLVLLVAYQSTCGALYERLAVMSALLMSGIALGSGLVARVAPALRAPTMSVALVLFATAGVSLVLGPVLQALAAWPAWAQQGTFALLFVATGVALGVGYPANTQALLSRSPGAGSAAAGGLIDALDHLGATAGALTVGTVILPAVGASATLLGLALLTGALGVGWLVPARAAR